MKEARRLEIGGRKSVKRIAIEQNNLAPGLTSPSTTKTRLSQRPTKNRPNSKATRREVSVYDGVNLLGTIKIAADGKSTAYNPRGKPLGSYPTFQAASAAFDNPPAPRSAG